MDNKYYHNKDFKIAIEDLLSEVEKMNNLRIDNDLNCNSDDLEFESQFQETFKNTLQMMSELLYIYALIKIQNK